ncbi:hypothetical protein ACFVFF_35630 [Streptomyces sp. NPDC057680]|uniref:hypothetical protein n=1 Tax=Streptomyces sp. NPDC057680 TaxID=3346208 RepID=UPI0036CDE722
MSITSSMPVLRGRGATVLSAVPGGLVLERPGGQVMIPFRAIARVHVEAREVTVELSAPAGAAPSLHRVGEVSAAAAAAFADAVNVLLPVPVEDIDGSALVEVRTSTRTWLQRFRRTLGRVLLGCLAGVLALSVTNAVAGDGRTAVTGALLVAALGALAVVGIGLGAVCVVPWFHETRRRRYGVTVIAEQADGPGMYRYADGSGTVRVFSHPAGPVPSLQACYDPRDPADVLVLQDRSSRLIDITLGSCFLLAGLGGIAAVVGLVALTILGRPLLQP